MKILVTGTAGFIGFHMARRLVAAGHEVLGLDCINEYYDVSLKHARLRLCGVEVESLEPGRVVEGEGGYRFVQAQLEDRDFLLELMRRERFDRVCHLAAQAGVRHSLEHPHDYIDSNILGFLNILEGCRRVGVQHLVYASSSSVYGLNEKIPFSVHDNVDHAISLYAATKKSNELMAHAYSHLFGVPTSGLRFFTVYGPWGRPDMALYHFTRNILAGEPIKVFNHGDMQRDFTYVDDIVEGIYRVILLDRRGNSDWDGMAPDPASSVAPYKVYNIGNSTPVQLMDFIHAIEEALGQRAELNLMPMQPGDVPRTWADTGELTKDTGFSPSTSIQEGVRRFVQWYREYFSL